MRERNHRVSAPVAGALTLLVVAIACYLGFGGPLPFQGHYTLHAVFGDAASIRAGSPVRIAGVDVGKVTGVERYAHTDAARVTMEIDDDGLPVHRDAELKIRPRLFLEGNFFVELRPGSPSGRDLRSGATIPVTQTAAPVQLDEVLNTLQSDTRDDLKAALAGYGQGLAQRPADGSETGGEALNHALDHSAGAFKGLAVVNQAALGERTHDLSQLIAGVGKVAAALDSDEGALQGLVARFDTTMAAFASRAGALRSTIYQLPGTLEQANATLADLREAFPPTRAFAREILPGVKEAPATIAAGFPWVEQTRRLLSQDELRGLVGDLQPTVASLSGLTDQTLKLLPQADLAAKCVRDVVLPTGDLKIEDGPLTTGKENYKEFWYAMVGLAGEGQNFDANGQYVRFEVGGGSQTLSLGKVLGEQTFAAGREQPLGVRPAYPGHKPPYNAGVPCYTQPLPAVNGPEAALAPPDGSNP